PEPGWPDRAGLPANAVPVLVEQVPRGIPGGRVERDRVPGGWMEGHPGHESGRVTHGVVGPRPLRVHDDPVRVRERRGNGSPVHPLAPCDKDAGVHGNTSSHGSPSYRSRGNRLRDDRERPDYEGPEDERNDDRHASGHHGAPYKP